jgi:hypothetical protein
MAGVAMLRPCRDFGIRKRIFWVSMAAQAVAHPHRHILINNIHRLHFTVAGLANDSGIHMRPMIEKHMVGQRMNSLPFHWLAGIIDFREFHYFRSIDPGHSVAIHAFLDCRNSCDAGFESAGVTIEAWDS